MQEKQELQKEIERTLMEDAEVQKRELSAPEKPPISNSAKEAPKENVQKEIPKENAQKEKVRFMTKEQRKNVEAVIKVVETTEGVVKGAIDLYGEGKARNLKMKIMEERANVECRKLRAEAEAAEGRARQEIGRARQEEAMARLFEHCEREYEEKGVQDFLPLMMSKNLALPEVSQAVDIQIDEEDGENGKVDIP